MESPIKDQPSFRDDYQYQLLSEFHHYRSALIFQMVTRGVVLGLVVAVFITSVSGHSLRVGIIVLTISALIGYLSVEVILFQRKQSAAHKAARLRWIMYKGVDPDPEVATTPSAGRLANELTEIFRTIER